MTARIATLVAVAGAGWACVVASWAVAMVEGSAKAAAIAVALARALSCFGIIMPKQPLGASE